MSEIYTVIVGILGILAVSGLFVGVTNDAVNFLNSAIGSKAASMKVILTVASIGIIVGVVTSSGMMEVARSGMFNPGLFTFHEVMMLYLGVMFANVILLDLYNSWGLPTSTTVSLIFCLLGAAIAVSIYKISNDPEQGVSSLGHYINTSRAMGIVSAILLSVVIAFTCGTLVMYVSRMIFSFRYTALFRRYGSLWCGASLTAIVYFAVFKGLKSILADHAFIQLIDNHLPSAIAICWVVCSLLLFFIQRFKVNILRITILSGTFALALAFAGNDLVNFIGVPLAALSSYEIWSAVEGADPTTFTMEGLRHNQGTPTYFLLASGLVMVLTLWFSKKAHRVIRTSISLASSARGGKEQFGSSLPARVVVRSAIRFNNLAHQIIPASVIKSLATRFEKKKLAPGEVELPFDEIRASVNLVLAAALIASATSLKLPLSTTYVTFMVAMGSSLADGAWDRESAVYRISGVLTVISGWFMTAFTAFTACGLICMLFISWGEPLQLIMMVLALIVVIRTNFFVKEEDETPDHERIDRGDKASIRDLLTESVNDNLNATLTLYAQGLQAFLDEDDQKLRELKGDAAQLFDFITMRRGEYYNMALEGGGSRSDRDARNFYYRAFTSMKEVSHSLRDQIGVAQNYVANSHSPFTGRMRDNIKTLSKRLIMIRDNFVPANCTQALELIDEAQRDFMTQIGEEKISLRKSELYLGYLLFAREVLNRYMMVKLLQSELEAGLAAQQQQQAAFAVEDDKDEPLQPSER